ncbi:hypothetical protein [Aeromonas enteropelogenes]|uniref:hypothetical protein n=1 Tax=Aeromonas enteropelogenes TaxID=29489 RepID=UPI003B9FCE3D
MFSHEHSSHSDVIDGDSAQDVLDATSLDQFAGLVVLRIVAHAKYREIECFAALQGHHSGGAQGDALIAEHRQDFTSEQLHE